MVEEIDKSKIDKHRDVAYIVVGNSQWKIKERNFSKEYAIGKYIRWDASEKTWKRNMERLKWLLSEDNPKYKDVKVLKLMIAEHGNTNGYYDSPKDGANGKIKDRFKEVVKIIKENFLDKDPNRKLYFKTSSCYGAFCMPESESEYGDYFKSKSKDWQEKEKLIHQQSNLWRKEDNVFGILADFFTKDGDTLDDKYKNRIWFTNVIPNNSVNVVVPILGEKKPYFFTMKKGKDQPGKFEYIKQHIKYLFSRKDAKTFVTDWLQEQQRTHPEWNIRYGSDRKVYFSLDNYCKPLYSRIKDTLWLYDYKEEQRNKDRWRGYIGDQAKNKKNSCIYSYACKNINNDNNINNSINKNDSTISH